MERVVLGTDGSHRGREKKEGAGKDGTQVPGVERKDEVLCALMWAVGWRDKEQRARTLRIGKEVMKSLDIVESYRV